MKKILLSAFFIFIICGVSDAFSLNVDPPSVWIKVASSESKSGIINLSNKGTETISVKSYAEDWLYAKDRSKEFKKPGSIERSCSQWISVFPGNFTIDPGEVKSIKYTITAPPNALGGYYSVIFFESRVKESEETRNSNVVVAGRIGTIIYAETEKGTVRNGAINEYSVSLPDKNKSMSVSFNFKNDGNVILSPKGLVLITDNNSNLFGKFDINKFNILPGEVIPVKSAFNVSLGKGEYNIVTTLDFDGNYPLTVEKKLIVN